MPNQLTRLLICSKVSFNEDMKKHTSINTGGVAKYYFEPYFLKDLVTIINYLSDKKIPYKIIGNGSNLVFCDQTYKGAVISLTGLNNVFMVENKVRAFCGATPFKVYQFCLSRKLCPFNNLIGIPGTIGGMTVMNAGSFGKSVSDYVSKVCCISGNKLKFYDKKECGFGYRTSRFFNSNEIIIYVDFDFDLINNTNFDNDVAFYVKKRSNNQPKGFTAGSVFKNPSNDYAGRLIESLNLKGERIGGAVVSNKHANFIINDGTATSLDVYLLANKIKDKVLKEYGINLLFEIEFVGDF